eukprot:2252572-Rhodomonas_salina.3
MACQIGVLARLWRDRFSLSRGVVLHSQLNALPKPDCARVESFRQTRGGKMRSCTSSSNCTASRKKCYESQYFHSATYILPVASYEFAAEGGYRTAITAYPGKHYNVLRYPGYPG